MREDGVDSTKLTRDLLGEDVKAIGVSKEQLRQWLGSMLTCQFWTMLSEGLADPKRSRDYDYLRSLLDKHQSKVLYKTNVLIATAVEHVLNRFIRLFLRAKKLSTKDITQIIRRNGTYDRASWLMQIVVRHQFPGALQGRISKLMELRNAVVHYKAEPSLLSDDDPLGLSGGSYWKLETAISDLDFDDAIALPFDVEDYCYEVLEEINPSHAVAVAMVQTMGVT